MVSCSTKRTKPEQHATPVKTDVIVISCPVFSPVRYMQMVGRGLRGMKNGGTATCHVVTMLDNIIEYSDRLAYHTYFTPYFQSPGGAAAL